jgi:hypothetical protein
MFPGIFIVFRDDQEAQTSSAPGNRVPSKGGSERLNPRMVAAGSPGLPFSTKAVMVAATAWPFFLGKQTQNLIAEGCPSPSEYIFPANF